MTIVLKYTKIDGRKGHEEFEDDVTEIDLSELDIAYIDLTPLSSCVTLKVFSLSDNRLEEIDLTPLSFCTALEYIYLQKNDLEYIDLSPLRACLNLKAVDLMDNYSSCPFIHPVLDPSVKVYVGYEEDEDRPHRDDEYWDLDPDRFYPKP